MVPLLLLSLTLASAQSQGPLKPYSAGPAESSVRFSARGPFGGIEGTFARYKLLADVDPNAFERSSISILVEAASLTCRGLPDRLLKAALRARRYPLIEMRSAAIRPLAEPGRYEVDLVIDARGKTRLEKLSVEFERRADGVLRLSGTVARTGSLGRGDLDFYAVLRPDPGSGRL